MNEQNNLLIMHNKMKNTITLFGAMLFASVMLMSCSHQPTVCDCLTDDGSHKKECDELGNRMSPDEMNKAIAKCK